jgi:hypothetical protein
MTAASELFQSKTSETADVDLFQPAAAARPYLVVLGSAAEGGQPPTQRLHAIEDGLELGRRRPRSGRSVRMLALADRCVSSNHARISRTAKGFEIVDLDSRNGTFLDGIAVKRQPLHDGALLFFGSPVIRVANKISIALPGQTAPVA